MSLFLFMTPLWAAESSTPSGNPWLFVSLALLLLAVFLAYRYIRLHSSLPGTHTDTDPDGLRRNRYSDISGDDRMEEQMFHQSRLIQMGEMISMIAHQWRQPLGAIASTAIGIETKIRLNKFDFSTCEGIEQAQDYLLNRTALIAKYVDALSGTIDDFRSFYQKDKSKEYMNVETAIRRSLGIIEGTLEQQGITIEIMLDSRCDIFLYPNEIVQVLLNILQNAYDQFRETEKHAPQITIAAHDINDIVHIEIHDNAGGIPNDILPKIFDPYFSTKEAKNGTGIGLYMSKIIIEDHHHGTLNAYNDSEGAKFVIQIPCEGRKVA